MQLATKLQFSFARAACQRRNCVVRFQPADTAHAHSVSTAQHRGYAPSLETLALHTAAKDLRQYCSVQKDAGCFDVYEWLLTKCFDEQGAEHDSSERMRQTVRELTACSSVDQLFKALAMMKRMEERRAVDGCSVAVHDIDQDQVARNEPNGDIRKVLESLFARLDHDHDGYLTWSEFYQALTAVEEELTEEEMELVGQALDCSDRITLEQFMEVISQAEDMHAIYGSSTPDTRFYSHLTHHHPSDMDHLHTL